MSEEPGKSWLDPSWKGPCLPRWFAVGKHNPRSWTLHVRAGRHPLGNELSSCPYARCGNCRHLARRGLGNTYIKCGHPHLKGVNTTQATDVRMKWQACNRWEPMSLQAAVKAARKHERRQ